MPPSTHSVPAAEIVRRLNLSLPVHIEGLIDPLGTEFSVHRENLMALLTTDLAALPLDSQSVAPFYMEMARAQRSCEWAAEELDTKFVRWKAQHAVALRKEREAEGGKKPTIAEVEESYRTDDAYEEMAMAPKSLRSLAGLFLDAKNAFLMKARNQDDQAKMLRGYEATLRYDDQQERLTQLEELEQSANEAVARSGSAKAAADYVASLKR